eukprot:7990239-Prorocentrum_lima.AAC.1
MTSSLVGSEMCIRDSSNKSPLFPNLIPEHKKYPNNNPDVPIVARQPWPVSYTHLTLPTICSV